MKRKHRNLFLAGYIAAIFSTSVVDDFFDDEIDLASYTIEDLHEGVLAQAERDCLSFHNNVYWRNRWKLDNLYAQHLYDPLQAGRDFWLARNDPNMGFLLHGFDEVWDELQASARDFGPVNLMLDIDGIIKQHWEN